MLDGVVNEVCDLVDELLVEKLQDCVVQPAHDRLADGDFNVVKLSMGILHKDHYPPLVFHLKRHVHVTIEKLRCALCSATKSVN